MKSRPPRPARRDASDVPWDPIRDLLGLKERMNRLLESALRKGGLESEGFAGWNPAVELCEDRDAYHLTAELPGVKREHIAVKVEGRLLTVEGKRLPDEGLRRGAPLRVERTHGAFSRTFQLPTPVDASSLQARFRLGVLELVLPKSRDGRTAEVDVPIV